MPICFYAGGVLENIGKFDKKITAIQRFSIKILLFNCQTPAQISFDLDEETLEYANDLYIKTGYTIQTLMRRELIKIARSGELPDYLKNNSNSIQEMVAY